MSAEFTPINHQTINIDFYEKNIPTRNRHTCAFR